MIFIELIYPVQRRCRGGFLNSEGAGRFVEKRRRQRVSTTRRAVNFPGNLAAGRIGSSSNSATPQIWLDISDLRYICGILIVFQSVLLDGGINLAEVVDAAIALRSGAGMDEVGNRDGRQEADDGHDDHDLNQREAAFWMISNFFHVFL